MRARFFMGFVLAAAVAVAACSAPKPVEFSKADNDAIRKLVQDFVAAYNAKDVERIGTLFAPVCVLMPANRSTLRGVDMVKSYYDERFKGGATNLQIEPQDVSGHGPLGYLTASFALDMPSGPGGAVVHDRGKVLWIVHNFAGQWKFEYQIMSSDLPPVVPTPEPAGKK